MLFVPLPVSLEGYTRLPARLFVRLPRLPQVCVCVHASRVRLYVGLAFLPADVP